MKGFIAPGLFAAAVIILVAAFAPRCTPSSPHGPRIGGAVLIEGCQ